MRFPSFQNIIDKTIKVINDYPLECITSIVGMAAGIELSYETKSEDAVIKILLIAALALPSYLAVTIRSRFRKFSVQRRWIEYGIVTAILILFFWSIDNPIRTKDVIRFFLLNVVAHLMVSCAGFVNRGSTHAFWQFNKELFLRIITAVIFSGVFFAGLSGALAAVDVLFHLNIPERWYFRLFIVVASIFNTWFFLASVPQNADELEKQNDYPKILKVFTQFVLVPLVIIYLIILLAYETKIIIQWKLPEGWVSNLILAYGVAGILSLLLVYPIRSMVGNNWIKTFAKWFYVLLIPLVVLMFVAILTRINAYGFTEERLFVLALAIWLTCISFFYLIKPNGDIRIIPLSLAFIGLVLTLTAFPISKASQRAKLKELLVKNNLLSNNKAGKIKEDQKVPYVDRKRLSSVVEYLISIHGTQSLQPWFRTDTLKNEKYSSYSNTTIVMNSMGLTYVDSYSKEDNSTSVDNKWYSYTSSNHHIAISGYDYLVTIKQYGFDTSGTDLYAFYDYNDEQLELFEKNKKIATIHPRDLLRSLLKKYGETTNNSDVKIENEEMQQRFTTNDWIITVYYNQLSGTNEKSEDRSSLNLDGIILLKRK